MTSLTIVGVGNMGGAILDGLLARGWPAGDLRTVDQVSDRCREEQGVARGDLAEMVADVDALLVAVKPNGVAELLAQAAPHLRADTVVISIAAGISTTALEAALGTTNPVVRVMPNTPAQVGQGVSVLSAGTRATDEHLDLVTKICSAIGQVEVLPESLQDAATGVSGSGPAYVFAIIDAMIEAGVQQGLPRAAATRMVAQTFGGAATMVAEGGHPALLREQVSSPGGTTVQGLRALDQHGMRAAIADAVEASARRSAELGKSS